MRSGVAHKNEHSVDIVLKIAYHLVIVLLEMNSNGRPVSQPRRTSFLQTMDLYQMSNEDSAEAAIDVTYFSLYLCLFLRIHYALLHKRIQLDVVEGWCSGVVGLNLQQRESRQHKSEVLKLDGA